MKKYIILAVTALSLVVSSCEQADVNDFDPPNYATFEANTMDFSVQQNDQASYDVTVYTADEVGSDRNVAINVQSSTTLNAESYTVPATVTIPANTNEGTFTVNLADQNLSNNGGTLVLRLGTSEDTEVVGQPLTINVSKICPFDIAGTYNNASGFFEAEFDVEVVAGENANQFVVKNLFADGTDITFTVNADNSITVPTQNAWVSGTYGQAQVTGQAGSKLEPCLGKITLALNHTVSAGSFGTITEVLTK